jgi:hypothetical protein
MKVSGELTHAHLHSFISKTVWQKPSSSSSMFSRPSILLLSKSQHIFGTCPPRWPRVFYNHFFKKSQNLETWSPRPKALNSFHANRDPPSLQFALLYHFSVPPPPVWKPITLIERTGENSVLCRCAFFWSSDPHDTTCFRQLDWPYHIVLALGKAESSVSVLVCGQDTAAF